MSPALLAIVLSASQATAPVGDPERGRDLYASRCGACHSIEADRVGPRHAGLIGRRAGSVAGFDYSPALSRSAIVWSAALLDRWLTDPEALIPGQKMGFRVADPQVRADIVAFLAASAGAGSGRQP